MSKAAQAILVVMLALSAMIVGYLVQGSRTAQETRPVQDASIEALLSASFPDLSGNIRQISSWRGKVLVVNFWATWCLPCREEIPLFVKLQEKYRAQGLQFVGIALDQKNKVQAYAGDTGINYPLLLGEADAIELTRQAGNRLSGLPFTVVIGRDGSFVAAKSGGLTEDKLETIIKPLL